MYRDKTVAVVIPAYNEALLIRKTVQSVPDFVDKIVVVNDQSTDRTAEIVQEEVESSDGRVVLITLPENEGVGGAVSAGYIWARDNEMECTVVMNGDAQMAPEDMPALLDPIVEGRADYTKGNRLIHGDAWNMIPRVRYLGNSGLSMLTKIASGYWHVADSQTGYTVANLEVLQTLDLESIYKRYGMPNDMLVKLNVDNFRVMDIRIKPIYNVGEQSGIKLHQVLFTISMLLLRLFVHRMVHKYVIRDFHPLVLFYGLGLTMLTIAVPLVVRLGFVWCMSGRIPPMNALAIVFCVFMGFQSILFAFMFDMEANRDLRGS